MTTSTSTTKTSTSTTTTSTSTSTSTSTTTTTTSTHTTTIGYHTHETVLTFITQRGTALNTSTFNQDIFIAGFVATLNTALGTSIFSVSSVHIVSVRAGSVIVTFDLSVPLISTPSENTIFCAVQAIVYNGQLLNTILATNPNLYKDVNIAFNSTTGCSSCICNSPTSNVMPVSSCNAGYSVVNATTCVHAAPCPATAACFVGQNQAFFYQCPDNETLSVNSASQAVCYAAANEQCSLGFTAVSTTSNGIHSFVCQYVCPSKQYFTKAGVCVRAITCPSGMYLDPSQPLSSLCQDVDECSLPQTCQNNGTCVNSLGSFTCTCKTSQGWLGANCTLNNLYCTTHANPCQNGGTCKPGESSGQYVCACTSAYTGSTCTSKTNDASTGSSSSIPIIAGAAGGGAFLVVLLLILFITWRRRRQATKEVFLTPMTARADLPERPVSEAIEDSDELDPAWLKLFEVIGQGFFGIVYRAELRVCVTCFCYYSRQYRRVSDPQSSAA